MEWSVRILVVESPAKSKTISKYLGTNFTVLPSYGHIRDLPSKQNSVDPANSFAMHWELSKTGSEFLKKLKSALTKADELLIATDPDREGEAICWHIIECIKDDLNKKHVPVRRVVFHEITKNAVLNAIANTRDVDQNLVNAYLTRRALDYLYGFTLSPLLWRRLPGCKSAGRVQSVALRMITDRENEIISFKSDEYWSIDCLCSFKSSEFQARLNVFNGKKLSKLSIKNGDSALQIKETIQQAKFSVHTVTPKLVKRSPAPPFITSTLQQEASRKLGFSTKKTMQLAQQLYEGVDVNGETIALITYMRTDSVNLSNEFVSTARNLIKSTYGDKYLPKTPNVFKNKVKNAQEAHEAIRPINATITPDKINGCIDSSLVKLYTLIWKRTIACQMEKSETNRVQVSLIDESNMHVLNATGSSLVFDGYLKVYEEGTDIKNTEDDDQKIPPLSVGDNVDVKQVNTNQHFTQPPPRYTEASLVKRMEELGIGRPSTYANVIQVLQLRKYAKITKKIFSPELNGQFVVAFLKNYFAKYVEYDFTATMEEDLDDISNNEKQWDQVLSTFWTNLSQNAQDVKKTTLLDVVNLLTHDLSHILFNEQEKDGKCPKCNSPLVLKLWSTSAYIGCSKYPNCDYRRRVLSQDEEEATEGKPLSDFPKNLGIDKDTSAEIVVKIGPFGPYVELQTEKKKRASIPKAINAATVDLDFAKFLLSLPKVLGTYENKSISVGNGRFGPYVLYDGKFISIKDFSVLQTITLESAIEKIVASKK